MNDDPDTEPGRRVRSLTLDDGVVAFDTETGRMLVTNPAGERMWRGLVAGHSRRRIVADVEARFDAPSERIAADLEAFEERLAEAASLGAQTPAATGVLVLDPVPNRPFRLDSRSVWPFPGGELVIESESREIVTALERLLEATFDDLEAGRLTAREVTLIRVWEEGGRYPIVWCGGTIDTGLYFEDAVSRLSRVGASVFAARDGWVASLHAAVVEREGRAIVLPAVSGTGKTTLAAWLVGRGKARLVNDDQAVLRSGDMALPPAASPLSIKNGAVPLLSALWPMLERLPVRRDRRGREIRELVVPPESRADAPARAIAIVVPNRLVKPPSDGARLREMSRAEMLRALTENQLTFAEGGGWESIVALVEWLAGMPCLSLDYVTLDMAEQVLETLWVEC